MPGMASAADVWSDRFSHPKESDLLTGLEPQELSLVEIFLAALRPYPACTRNVRWHGIPWRWTIYISTPAGDPVAFIIPKPGQPQVAIPLTTDDIDRLSLRKLSKSTRECILGARAVGTMLWPEWALTSRTQVEELTQLLRARLAGLGREPTK